MTNKNQRPTSTTNTIPLGISPEAMVDELQQRIDYLQTIQEAILFAYYNSTTVLNEVEFVAEQPTKQKKAVKAKKSMLARRKYSLNHTRGDVYIAQALDANGPLTVAELAVAMTSQGWKSRALNPRAAVSTRLSNMRRAGDVTRTADGKWTLTTAFQAALRAASAQNQTTPATEVVSVAA